MEIAFFILAVIIVVSSAAVVVFPNTIHSALALIGNLIAVAGIFALLEAHFLATVQIIVYAGAIMVLFVFLIMLLNLKVEFPRRQRFILTFLGAAAGVLFLAEFVPAANSAFSVFPNPSKEVIGSVQNMGAVLYRANLFPFEAASVLILAAMVGAVMLAKRRYRDDR